MSRNEAIYVSLFAPTKLELFRDEWKRFDMARTTRDFLTLRLSFAMLAGLLIVLTWPFGLSAKSGTIDASCGMIPSTAIRVFCRLSIIAVLITGGRICYDTYHLRCLVQNTRPYCDINIEYLFRSRILPEGIDFWCLQCQVAVFPQIDSEFRIYSVPVSTDVAWLRTVHGFRGLSVTLTSPRINELAALSHMPELTDLVLYDMESPPFCLDFLKGHIGLRKLWLGRCSGIVGPVDDLINTCPNLEEVVFDECAVTEAEEMRLNGAANIRRFDLVTTSVSLKCRRKLNEDFPGVFLFAPDRP